MRNMRRFTAIFSLMVLAATSILFMPSQASACEDPITPLRGLFMQSHLIVVGTLGTPGKWKSLGQEKDADFQYFSREFPVHVEEVIKGASTKSLYVTEMYTEYLMDENGKAKPVSPAPTSEVTSELADKKGRQIFFLEKDEDGNFTLVYTGREIGSKPEELKLYVSRLNELAEMSRGGEPDKMKTIEWLVGMLENPVTRYDGAYELQESFYLLNHPEDASGGHDEHGEPPTEAAAEGENTPAEGGEENGGHEEGYVTYGDAEFAKLLTAAQKERIVKAFLGVKFLYEPKKYEGSEDTYYDILSENDLTLMNLAGELRDRRVSDRLLAELPKAARHEAWFAVRMMEIIGDNFKDEKIKTIAQKYSDVSYGNNDDMIEEKASAYDGEMSAAALAKLPSKTFGARRAELLNQMMMYCANLTAKK